MTSATYISKRPCPTCDNNRRYVRSDRCVHCVARINQKYTCKVIKIDRKQLEETFMCGVEYENEKEVRA